MLSSNQRSADSLAMMEDLEQRYNAWHRDMKAAGGLSENPLHFPWYEAAFDHMRQHALGEVLEIGCGRGEYAVWLAKQIAHINITAIDFSHDAIEIAKAWAIRNNCNVRFKQDDAQRLNFSDSSFDYVASCECMEHVSEPARMAHEIHRVLKPGGRFCLTTENYLNGMTLAWAKCWFTGEPFNSGSGAQPIENFFFFWNVAKYLRSAGLVIESTKSCHYQWLLLPHTDPAKLCTTQFSHQWARWLAKPFGRHFSFFGCKPTA
jgi:ubiquinone/menaquinone biosynthesis C-methylase UbiE